MVKCLLCPGPIRELGAVACTCSASVEEVETRGSLEFSGLASLAKLVNYRFNERSASKIR